MSVSNRCFSPKSRRWWPPWRGPHAVLSTFFGLAHSDCYVHDLPRRYPPYQTCHRRFQQWQRSGLLTELLRTGRRLTQPREAGFEQEAFRASFSSAKKGALLSALPAAAKAAKSWRSAMAMVFLSPCTWPALRRMKQSSSKPRSSGDSSTETSERDRRARLRQRFARRTDSRAVRRGVGRTAQLQAQPEGHAGRPRTAPLPASLEDRTSVRLAS